MLVFRNEIPVTSEMTLNDFWDLMNAWVSYSPHTNFVNADFELLAELDKIDSSDKKEVFERKYFSSSTEKIAGIKYIKKESKQEWITTIIFNISKSLIAIEIECETSILGEILPQVHVPYVMKRLVKWGGEDGGWLVNGKPHNLQQCDIDQAKDIMNGNFSCKKPVVYLSATYNNTHVINPNILAHKLFGLAHVVVEPNKEFGERLALDIKEKRPSLGRIGIYYSDSQRHDFMQRFDDSHNVFIDKIQKRIITITRMASIDETCSWYYLDRCIDKQNWDRLKAEKEEDYAKFSETFEAMNATLEKENARLSTENKYLRSENQRLSSTAHNKNSLLSEGEENEFYQGEKLSLILELLQHARSQCNDRQMRRKHIIDSILAANPLPEKKSEIIKKIKSILSNWQNSPSDRAQLHDLGFSVSEAGKHIKLTWRDDSRYTITVAKTPSDSRSNKNNASDALKLLFG